MQEQQSRLIRVNSKYREDTQLASNSDFAVAFSERSVDRITSIFLVSASIPRMYNNIFAGINTFSYSIGAGPVISYIVPSAQYTAAQLAAALTTLLPSLGVAYDSTLERFTYSTGEPTLTIVATSIAPYLGITADLVVTSGASPVAALYPPSLQGPTSLYIESTYVASVNCLDSIQQAVYIDTIASIDASAVPWGFDVNYTVHTRDQSMISFPAMTSLRRIDIQITDRFGNVLDLPANSYTDFLFRVEYSLD